MLQQAVTITASTSIGDGQYSVSVIFSDAGKAPFTRQNDVLEDKDGFKYRIDTWANFPDDFSSGSSLTVTFIDADQAPAPFGGFGNALILTPDQIDVRPSILSGGNITNQSLNSGQNYRYNIDCVWFSSSAINAAAGDQVLDSAGKVYEIVSAQNNATKLIVEEVLKEGDSPDLGQASVYTPTGSLKLFQGTPVSDPARTVVRNRDNYILDSTISSGGGGGRGDSESARQALWLAQNSFEFQETCDNFVLTSNEIEQKFVDVTDVIEDASCVKLYPSGGPIQVSGTDFTVIENDQGELKRISWDGTFLDGVLEEQDTIQISYKKKALTQFFDVPFTPSVPIF